MSKALVGSRRKIKKLSAGKFFKHLVVLLVVCSTILGSFPSNAFAAAATIRQEVNILDGETLSSSSASQVESQARVTIDTTKYTSATYYFEAVYSGAASNTGTIKLSRAGTSTYDASLAGATSATNILTRSSSFAPPAGSTTYTVSLVGDGTRTQTVKAARIIIIQNANPLLATQTQIEIGNAETGKTNTSSSALTSPKYWNYDSTKWDGTTTFYAETTWKKTNSSSGISYVGGAVNSLSPNGNFSVTLPGGMQSGDLIVVAAGVGDTVSNGLAAPTEGGYTRIGSATIYANSTNDINLDMYYKFHNGTDTTVSFAGVGGTNASDVAVVKVFRGVASVAAGGPFDTTVSTTSGTGSSTANPPSHNWSGTSGVWTLAVGATGHTGGATATFTGPTGYTTDFAYRAHDDTIDALVGMGYKSSPSDPEDPGTFTAANIGTAASNAWAAATISLKPSAPTFTAILQEDNGSFSGWANKVTIANAVSTDATTTITRSSSFTPTTGRNYRIVTSQSESAATHDIYNAKIIIDQTSGSAITKLEPQYLMGNTQFTAGTGAQSFLTKWDPAEWSGVSTTFTHEANSQASGTSDIGLKDTSVNISKNINAQDGNSTGITFRPDGLKMYDTGNVGKAIDQYSLTSPFDISTATYDSVTFSVSSQESGVTGVTRFDTTGTKMYFVGYSANTVFQYSLATPWDISTASYASKSFDCSASCTAGPAGNDGPFGLYMKEDGTKMYILDTNSTGGVWRVLQYTLSTPWDVSTASYDSKSATVPATRDVFFKPDGTKMFVSGYTTNNAYQYSLSTPWDVSTATSDSLSFTAGGLPLGSYMSPDGLSFFSLATNADVVYRHQLYSAWSFTNPQFMPDTFITDVANRDQSSAFMMPSTSTTLDVTASSNNSDIYGSRILVKVDVPITVSGTANGNNGATVKVAIDGIVQAQTATIGSGTWSISMAGVPVVNDIITAWIDGVADSLESTAVTKFSSGTTISGMVLNTNVVSIGSNQNTSLSLTELMNNYSCTKDEDVMYSVINNISPQLNTQGESGVCAGGVTNSYTDETLSVLASNTLTQATTETISTEKVDNAGTITVTSFATLNLAGTSGTLLTNSGTFTPGLLTVNLTGNGSATINSGSISIPYINSTGTGTKSVASTITTSFVQASAGTIGGSGTLSFNGSNTPLFNITGSGVFSGPNVDVTSNGAYTLNTGAISPTNLTISGTGTKSANGAINVGGNLSISNASGTLSIGANDLSVTGTSSISGTFLDSNTGGVNLFTGAVTINSGGIWNSSVAEDFEFRGGLTNNSTAGFTSGSGTYTFSTNQQDIAGTQSYTITNIANNITAGNGLVFTGAQPTVTSLTQGTNASLSFTGSMPTVTTLTATASGNNVNYTSGGSQTIKATTYHNLAVNKAGATATLGGTTTVNGTLYLLAGTLDGGNQNINIGTVFNLSNSTTRALTMGSGTWTLSGTGLVWDASTSTNLTVTPNTSIIKVTDTSSAYKAFDGGGKTYSTLWYSPGSGTGSFETRGSNTFDEFKDDGGVGHSLLFTAGTTTTVTSFSVTGSNSSNRIIINSGNGSGGTSTSTHTLTKAGGGTINRDYLDIQHSIATPANTWYTTAANSIDNNSVSVAGSGWIFSVPFVFSGTSSGLPDGTVIKAAVSGIVSVATGSVSSNAWSFTPTTAPGVHQSVILFADNVADNLETNAIAKYTGSGSMTGMVLNAGSLSIGSDNNQSGNTYIDTIDDYTCSDDEDIMYSAATGGTLNLQGCSNSYTDETLSILASGGLNVGTTETVTTEKINNAGALTSTGNSTYNLAGTSGTLFTNSGSFTQATSTVNLTGNGNATINSGTPTFYNLTSSGTGTKTLGGNITIAASGSLNVNAGTFAPSTYTVTSSNSGQNLNVASGATLNVTASTFDGNYPGGWTYRTLDANSTVDYNRAGSQTVDGTLTHGNLTISGSGTKSFLATQTINGVLTVSAGTLDTTSQAFSAKSIVVNGGVFTPNYSTATISGNTGTLITFSSGTFDPFGGSVVLSGNGNATINSAPIGFYTLNSTGTGTKTLGANITVGGNLNIDDGTFDPSSYLVSMSGGSINNYGILRVGSTNISGSYTGFSGTGSDATSTLEYSKAGDQNITSTFGAGNLLLGYNLATSGSGTKTIGDDIAVSGSTTIGSSTTLALSSYTLSLGGTGSSVLVNNGSFSAGTGKVKFTGDGAVTVPALSYYNLELSPAITNNRSYTLNATTISNNFVASPSPTSSPLHLSVDMGANLVVTGSTTLSSGNSNGGAWMDTIAGNNRSLTTSSLSLSSGGLLLARDSTITLTGTSGTLLSDPSGNFTPGGSTVVLSGNGSATATSGTPAFYNLTISGTGTKTLGSDTTIGGALNISNASGTLNAGAHDISVTGTVTNSGTFTAGTTIATNSWQHYRAITIDYTKVPNTDQTNFPVLIKGTYPYLKTIANGGNVNNASGYDVAFFPDSTLSNPLKFEIEKWDATTGEAIYWVKVPSVSHTTNTTIYMAYGNSAVTTNLSDRTNVWDSNYKTVFHFPNGSTLSGSDSTSNANNGTISGTSATTGKIDGGANFSNCCDFITLNSDITLGANYTISTWFNSPLPVTGSWNTITRSSNISGEGDHQIIISNTGILGVYDNQTAGGFRSSGYDMDNLSSGWHYITAIGSGTTTTFYIDGVSVGTSDYKSTSVLSYLGNYQLGGQQIGKLDELRISTTNRSADWIAAEYNNQSSPSTFYNVGGDLIGSTITVGGNWTNTGTVNAGASTIKMTSSSSPTFAGGGQTYYNLWLAQGSGTGNFTISGNNTFYDLKDDGTGTHSILFTAGSTQHVTTWNVSGTPGHLISINSTTTGTHSLIKDGSTSNPINANYLNIQHSVASPAGVWLAGNNSVDNQGVSTVGSGWIFATNSSYRGGGGGSGGGEVDNGTGSGTCADGIQNGNETGVDTGGRCANTGGGSGGGGGGSGDNGTGSGTCADGQQNGNETGVDTGGRCGNTGGGSGGGGGGDSGFLYIKRNIASDTPPDIIPIIKLTLTFLFG